MVDSKKDNRVTRFADEIVAGIEQELLRLSEARDVKLNDAEELHAQIRILDHQVIIIKESLAKGSYENGETK